jgi:anti-sigma factor RsiW
MTTGDRERHEAPPFEGAGDDLPSPDELELFAYLDGELDDEATARFEARLATDRELSARLQANLAIAGFVRDDAGRMYAGARVDDLVADVLAKLEAERPLAPVVEIGAAQQLTRAHKARSGSVVWIAFGAVAAAAAAIALFAGPRRDPSAGAPVATVATSNATASAVDTVAVNVVPIGSRDVEPPLPTMGTPGVEVEDLEVGEGATVIYTGSAQGAVVWVNDKH